MQGTRQPCRRCPRDATPLRSDVEHTGIFPAFSDAIDKRIWQTIDERVVGERDTVIPAQSFPRTYPDEPAGVLEKSIHTPRCKSLPKRVMTEWKGLGSDLPPEKKERKHHGNEARGTYLTTR